MDELVVEELMPSTCLLLYLNPDSLQNHSSHSLKTSFDDYQELELHLMVLSAFDNGPGRAAGWPTSKQGGA